MLDYQSFMCPKCGKVVLRTDGANYCQYCGAKLPELKEIPKVVCPMCHGEGKVEMLERLSRLTPHRHTLM